MRDDGREEVGSAGESILRTAGISESRIRELERTGRPMTIGRAMNLAAVAEQMVVGGLTPAEVDTLFPVLVEADLSTPRVFADAVTALVSHLSGLGAEREAVISLALYVAHAKTAAVAQAAEDVEASVRAGLDAGVSAATACGLVVSLLDGSGEGLKSRVELALAPLRALPDSGRSAEEAVRGFIAGHKGGRGMTDPKMRNGSGASGNLDRERERERLEREREALDREREKMDRERERADREREKLDRERERLDHVQEELEQRLERQEERLEELEEQLEERMEALDDAAADLDDIEVQGVEGIREVLDVITDRMPGIVRGIQESVYSPERIQATADAFATFYKTLVASGMPDHLAVELTRQHFDRLQSEMRSQMGVRTSTRRSRGSHGSDVDPLGPNFDPLGPNFDPLGGRYDTPEPPEPAEPAEPCGD